MLCDGGEDMDRQPVRRGHVARHKLATAIHQGGNERDITREPIEFRDDQHSAGCLRMGKRSLQFRPVIRSLAALDFHVFADQRAMPVDVFKHSRALRFQAKAALPLPLRTDA